jgi:hypothetical protein
VIITNRPVNEGVKADDQSFDFAGLGKLLELNIAEIENYGPNPQLVGEAAGAQSGRAIALLQQGGIAELGPYILAFRGWKIRVYRAIWNAIQRHWKAERWIRVTDDEGWPSSSRSTGCRSDPDGQPSIVNALGSLDVDIIMDEAPDSVNTQGQNFELLQALGPQFALQYPELVIELSPLDASTKKKMREKSQQPNPQQQLLMAEGAGEGAGEPGQDPADFSGCRAQARADAEDLGRGAHDADADDDGRQQPGPSQPQEYELPPELQNAEAVANIDATQAKADHSRAQAFKAIRKPRLLTRPQQMQLDRLFERR